MKKKTLALLLCLVLGTTLLAACGGNDDPVVEEPPAVVVDPDPGPAEVPPPAGVAAVDSNLPTPTYHFTFEENDEGIVPIVRSETPPWDGLTNGIEEDASLPLLFTDGPVGRALYIDGTHGVRFPVGALNTNTFTISFWINADRLSQFGPALQMGNIAANEDAGEVVTWLNFTQVDFTGQKEFPTVWNRNSENGQWPWINTLSADERISGRREWAMFTLVVTGQEYTFDETGETRIATDLYINGELVFAANDGNFEYHGFAPDVLKDYGNFDCLWGLNYWDELFKGYLDDFYIFSDSLTAGQVAYLWSIGDPTVETAVPEIEEEPVAQVVTTIDDSALYTLGDPDTEVLGWWSEHSDAYELADGGTLSIKFNNYGRNFNNWDNYVFALSNMEYSHDAGFPPHEADGYAEYCVVRGDAFFWGEEGLDVTFEFDWEWDDFQAIMSNAQVTLNFSRDGGVVTMDGAVLDMATGNEYNYDCVITTATGDGNPIFVFLTGEKMYLEVLEVN